LKHVHPLIQSEHEKQTDRQQKDGVSESRW